MSKFNWEDIGIDSILANKNSEGARYLELFLKDYTALTGEFVNAGCNKCIAKYLNNYKQKISNMENDSKYRLHKKREGIPLSFGSNIRVTNRNISDTYAKQLIKRYKEINKDFELSNLFAEYPIEEIKVEAVEVIEEEIKPKRKRRTKKD